VTDSVSTDGIRTLDLPNGVSIAFDIDAFDEAIRAHGVRFVHYRAMRNPVGMVDRNDSRRPDPDHSGASNGMLYTKAGCFTALFTGNTKELKAWAGGALHAGLAQITPARFYDTCPTERVYLQEKDRLYLETESVLVPCQQLVEVHATGRDRLQFPAQKVQDLVDAQGVRYTEGMDFDLVEGDVVWRPGKTPAPNAELNKGRVYGVRFLFRPHWYVEHMMHETRVAQWEDILGNRKVEPMPQAAAVQREYVYLNEKNDPEAKNQPSKRQEQAPPTSQFGPR
jgi:hypothetical protein